MNKLAIVINSFNRPEYLKRTLNSLERNVDLRTVDFYLYQDGAENPISSKSYTSEKIIRKCVRVFEESSLPNKKIRIQPFNIGSGLQKLQLFDDLFPYYEYVVSIDDDLEFNKYYIRTLNTLFRQFKDTDVGMVQTSLRDYRDVPQKTVQQAKGYENQVQYGFSRRWEQGLWKKSWELIRPLLQPLVEELKNCDFKLLLGKKSSLQSTRERILKIYGSCHADLAIENSLLRVGLQGICTRVCRHKGFGKEGFYTFTPAKWKVSKLDEVVLHNNIGNVKKYEVANNELCIAIRTLKRAHYLEELLTSLAKSVNLNNTDFYFYIDGAVNSFSGIRYAEDEEITECLRVIQSAKLPNKIIRMKKENVQTAIQKYEMLSTLFPRYDYVMLLDNDLVVNKYYAKTIRVLFRQFKDDPKAGILGTFYTPPNQIYVHELTFEKARELANKVQYGFSRRWEQGIWKECWERIKPYYEIYMESAGKCDYKQLLDNDPAVHDKRAEILKYFPKPNADLALEFAAFRDGYLGLHTEVPRHKGIGVEGMYSYKTEEFWKNRGLDKVKLYDVGGMDKYFFRTETKYAEDYRDLFTDKIVYIVGSGPSLDTYPDDFLDDKTGITLHLAYLKFPEATFRGICEAPIIEWLKKNRPEFFKGRGIFTNPFHPGIVPQQFLGQSLGEIRKEPSPIFVRYLPGEGYLLGTSFKKLIKRAINGKPVIAGAKSTVLHSILFAALTMGARDIRLIGCDHSKKKDKVYYSLAQEVEARELRVRYRGEPWYRPWMCERQQSGTDDFMDECRKNNIQMIRYRDYNHWLDESFFGSRHSEENYFGESPPKYRPGARG